MFTTLVVVSRLFGVANISIHQILQNFFLIIIDFQLFVLYETALIQLFYVFSVLKPCFMKIKNSFSCQIMVVFGLFAIETMHFSKSAQAQLSPYYYTVFPDQGITSILHLRHLHKCFFYVDQTGPKEIIQKADGKSFQGDWNFSQTTYFDHALKFYYDKYLNDPSKNKSDWDYTELFKQKDHTRDIGSNESSVVVGNLVYVVKVNGKEAFSFILSMTKHVMSYTTVFDNMIWDTREFRPPPKNNNKNVIKSEYNPKRTFFPLMYYMREYGMVGNNKVEFKVYPGKVNCKAVSDRSDEIMASGEFTLVLTDDILKELKAECKTKLETEMQVYTLTGEGFAKF